MGLTNCLVTDILQNILFCVQQKKGIHAGLEQLESEYDTIFIFGWTIPLRYVFFFSENNSSMIWRAPEESKQIFTHDQSSPKKLWGILCLLNEKSTLKVWMAFSSLWELPLMLYHPRVLWDALKTLSDFNLHLTLPETPLGRGPEKTYTWKSVPKCLIWASVMDR